MSTRVVTPGASAPLGVTVRPGGVNFSVFSKGAVLVELLLFDDANAIRPARVIPLKADGHHTHHYWHVFVPDLQPGQVYAYRAHGPFAPEHGSRFDAEKILLDPYGLAVSVPERYDWNLSWNCGVEGPTDDLNVEALRDRQVKNFFALTLLAAGTPMLLMGDEVRRTQKGNNNAYCQDSDISWFDWSLLERHGDIHRFVTVLNRFRRRRDVVAEGTLSLRELLHRARIEWHGVVLKRPDWSDHSRSLAFTLQTLRDRFLLHGMLNAYWEPLTFELPPAPAEGQQWWRRCIDTALDLPDDICPWETAPVVTQATYVAQPRSVVLLALALEGSTESVPQAE